MSTATWQVGTCPQCQEPNRSVGPLHGEAGGPLYCLTCGVEWHAKHGRRLKCGRIVLNALKAFFEAGGTSAELHDIKMQATLGELGLNCDLYSAVIDTIPDITAELLSETLRLTHPDVQPPERRELAARVTSALLSLKPYVFPAPKPQRTPPPTTTYESAPPSHAAQVPAFTRPAYPCDLCRHELPYRYCTVCRKEWTRRQDEKAERERHKQRAWYLARKARKRRLRRPSVCAACTKVFTPERAGTKYCSPACRQRAHRQRVTERIKVHGGLLKNRYEPTTNAAVTA